MTRERLVDGALAGVVLFAQVGLPVLLAAIVWRAWVEIPLRVLVWPSIPVVLAVVCIVIARRQRRGNAALDWHDGLRRAPGPWRGVPRREGRS